MLIGGCQTHSVWYGEVEHLSSIPNGKPFNSRTETSSDMIWTGIKTTYGAWYIDASIGADLSGELEGRNPYGKFVVGKELKTWGD